MGGEVEDISTVLMKIPSILLRIIIAKFYTMLLLEWSPKKLEWEGFDCGKMI